MAHQIEKMAYAGDDAPWHALGSRLPAKQPLEVWAQHAGLDWKISETAVRFIASESPSNGNILAFGERKVLYRDDTHQALSVVSQRYKVVQPRDILEFYRDLTEASGYEMETAGCLRGGRKIWALARTGKETKLKGNDVVKGYLLLASSCDGSICTTATFTSIRVVCANTLAVALDNARGAVKVPHSTTFDAARVKAQLSITVAGWQEFMYRMRHLSERKVSDQDAEKFLRKLMDLPQSAVSPTERLTHARGIKKMHDLFKGEGKGAELASAKGTAWGVLNAVTQHIDHERRTRHPDLRRESAWFGAGAALKDRALAQALELLA